MIPKGRQTRGLGTKPGGFETDVSRIVAKHYTSVSDGDMASSGVNGMVVLTGGQCLAPLLCSVRFCELTFACLGRAQIQGKPARRRYQIHISKWMRARWYATIARWKVTLASW